MHPATTSTFQTVLIGVIPSGRWRLSIGAGFSGMEIAGDESIEARRDGCRLRSERDARVSHAVSLQRLAVEQCVTRRIAGVDRHERVGIGGHRVNGVQILINNDAVLSENPQS